MKLRAAVIGLGFIGAGDHISGEAIGQLVADLDGTHSHALAAYPQVELVSGSSRDAGRRNRFEERHRVSRTYADWREMLAREKLDIVSVATNSPYHAEITIACAEAGVRAVLCEKPIATRLSDADRAIAACRKRGTVLVINHSRRWHPLWRRVRDEIRSGAIGRPQEAAVHWGSGRLGNVGTHMFDALRMLLGSEPLAVSGSLDPIISPDCRGRQYCDPGGWGIVSFSNDVRAFIHAAHNTSLPFEFCISGDVGRVSITEERAVIERWNGPTQALQAANDGLNSLTRAVQETVQCLAGHGVSSSTGEDGLAALEVIIGFHVSERMHGQWTPLPIAGADRDLEVRIG